MLSSRLSPFPCAKRAGAEAPLEAIQEILGHSDIGTTRRVYALFKPAIRTILGRQSGSGGGGTLA